jgi:feruloyl esterase
MIATIAFGLLGAAAASGACESLTTLKVENATITSAAVLPEGPPPRPERTATQRPVRNGSRRVVNPAPPEPPANIPEHCRVQLDLKPTSDSLIKMEMWLPTQNWNGKFMGVGNGGFAGSIQGRTNEMPQALRLGYATAGTDTGHQEQGGNWGIGHPEKMIDFAYRSTHEMTQRAKDILKAYYDQNPRYSYFKGCSTGGRMAVMEAQRYPEDYDGIIAGSLANRHIHMWTSGIERTVEATRHPEGNLTEAKADLVNDYVLNKCDTLKEGFLNNPRQCKVDFSKLLCTAGKDEAICLTAPELKTVETFYGGVKNSKGELIFSGQALGNPISAQRVSTQGPTGTFDIVKIAFNDANLDWRKFDLDRDMPLIDEAVGYVDAVNPDLGRFKQKGGKLLLTHGWADPSITPENTILYYESVLNKIGENQSDWLRLFMAPGMGHCRGGDGVNTFDSIGAMENWVEKGIAPNQMTGKGAQGFTRPMCPYPQYAEYKGSGDVRDGSNWTCTAK